MGATLGGSAPGPRVSRTRVRRLLLGIVRGLEKNLDSLPALSRTTLAGARSEIRHHFEGLEELLFEELGQNAPPDPRCHEPPSFA